MTQALVVYDGAARVEPYATAYESDEARDAFLRCLAEHGAATNPRILDDPPIPLFRGIEGYTPATKR